MTALTFEGQMATEKVKLYRSMASLSSTGNLSQPRAKPGATGPTGIMFSLRLQHMCIAEVA